MSDLIKVSENNGKPVVSAKELYLFLGFDKSQWSRWSKSNIIENKFACENEDYVGVRQIVEGNITSDFAITVDFAKRLSMMAKTEKGEQARQYFIECEKRANKPMTQSELILQSAKMLVEFEQKQNELEKRIIAIENKPQINAPVEHFSILGYCHNIGKQISVTEARTLSIKCKRMCNDLGLVVGKVSDPRFGSVNTYPLDVLTEIIK